MLKCLQKDNNYLLTIKAGVYASEYYLGTADLRI